MYRNFNQSSTELAFSVVWVSWSVETTSKRLRSSFATDSTTTTTSTTIVSLPIHYCYQSILYLTTLFLYDNFSIRIAKIDATIHDPTPTVFGVGVNTVANL